MAWHDVARAGERFVTFDGIAKACAKAAGAPEPELVHFNAKEFDFGKEKAFPMRDQHFFASVDKVCACARGPPPCMRGLPGCGLMVDACVGSDLCVGWWGGGVIITDSMSA